MDWQKLMKKAKTAEERDKITNQYLRARDPYYLDTSSNKKDKIKYPYHTPNQAIRVAIEEVPESSLNMEGTIEAKRKGIAENKTL